MYILQYGFTDEYGKLRFGDTQIELFTTEEAANNRVVEFYTNWWDSQGIDASPLNLKNIYDLVILQDELEAKWKFPHFNWLVTPYPPN